MITNMGAVGDCWFLSALAVVAERPDLVLRLFRGETATQRSGRYEVQLFLDGKWTSVVVDDQLPCVGAANQRRPDGSGLVFSRAKDSQLWVPVLEKAYAKAHGSYKAISGGSVAEALQDLTGAPCESIDLEAVESPGELWEQLVSYHLMGLPMGCGTAGHPELAEVGLVGYHAYSILDLQEVDHRDVPEPLRCGGSEPIQLLKLRNPHGMGEWNGEWSDNSVLWTELLETRLGRSGSDDGTFWMDFMHFLMAFQVVDVCFAHPSWNSRSFQNSFCAKTDETRLCRFAYFLELADATSLCMSAIQPTKRGTFARDDRKRFYQPGDVSLLLVELQAQSECGCLIAGRLGGSSARSTLQVDLPAGKFLLCPLVLGPGPLGLDVSGPEASAWTFRLHCSHPVSVQPASGRFAAALERTAAAALRSAALPGARGLGPKESVSVKEVQTGIFLIQKRFDGVALLSIAHMRSGHGGGGKPLLLQVVGKAMWARGATGLLTAKRVPPALEQKLPCQLCAQSGHASRNCPNSRRRPRYVRWSKDLAPWQLFEVDLQLEPGKLALCMALVASSEQGTVGFVATVDGRKNGGGYAAAAGRNVGPFASTVDWDEEEIRRCSELNATASSEEEQIARAIALSLAEQQGQEPGLAVDLAEDVALQAALVASMGGGAAPATQADSDGQPKASTKAESQRGKARAKAANAPADAEVAEAIAALARGRPGGSVSVNELNQDAGCKKVLKPLQKKHGVKLGKAWLEKFPSILSLSEEGSSIVVRAKTCKWPSTEWTPTDPMRNLAHGSFLALGRGQLKGRGFQVVAKAWSQDPAITIFTQVGSVEIDRMTDAQGDVIAASDKTAAAVAPSGAVPNASALWVKQGVDMALVTCVVLAVQKLGASAPSRGWTSQLLPARR
ncbi:sol [Symbiodinium natans]|uniref:Sol protein n=1 Tax=Symbiodinium natans TaxID=878477 RepID=A0A812TRJ8_9DINO|nr:sol [Symbiodinium natans]